MAAQQGSPEGQISSLTHEQSMAGAEKHDLNASWCRHLPWCDTRPSRRTAQRGPDWLHRESSSSHLTQQRWKCSGRSAAFLSYPPDPPAAACQFWTPAHKCSPTARSRAAWASSCYSKSVTFTLGIKPPTLRITSFVVIHVTKQPVQHQDKNASSQWNKQQKALYIPRSELQVSFFSSFRPIIFFFVIIITHI